MTTREADSSWPRSDAVVYFCLLRETDVIQRQTEAEGETLGGLRMVLKRPTGQASLGFAADSKHF